jgi:opacity protein-like surface antigen
MRKLVMIIFLIACGASLSFAQMADDQPKNQFFAGYSFNSADINTLTIDPHRTAQNGINLEYTRNITRHVGITGDASAHFHRETRSATGGTFTSKRDQYFLLGGLQFKTGNGKRVQPFAHALFGASLFRGFTSNIRTTGNVYTFDDATSFAMALGGGLDVQLSGRIDVRLIQADYAPTFFGSGRQNNFRLSFGLVFKR